jgi:hypothetical protein
LESHHLVWSATSCDYPGAALFFGLARHSDIASLCTWRTKRQVAVYNGSPVRALGDRMLPTYYLAVRDPSCIKVKSVEQPLRAGGGVGGGGNGVRYVSLIFERDRPIAASEATALLRTEGGHDGHSRHTDAAFVVTVSLPVLREESFSREVLPQGGGVGGEQLEEWTEMFDRLCNLAPPRG